jgi:MFS family permease
LRSAFEPAITSASRRTPALIIACGCLAAVLSFGPRSGLGFFQTPIISAHGWGRDTYAFALAAQNLLWGIGQPFMGAVADRFGSVKVLTAGSLLYALGLALMAYSTTPFAFDLTAGVLIGLGLAGCSFNIVLAAFGKLLAPEKRSMAFGLGTAAGSAGQFIFAPLSVGLIQAIGWQETLVVYGLAMLAVIPLSTALATRPVGRKTHDGHTGEQSLAHALGEALRHPSYVLLVLGFFTCGFQLAFITVHMPAYLADLGLAPWVGGWTIALIGVFNVVGSLTAGWLGNRMPKRWILALIYFGRSLVIAAFLLLPASPAIALAFGALFGLLWLSTVPPTSSLVAIIFGTRHLAMLFGFAFFSHQVGAFLGVWLGGVLYVRTGSYDIVWWLSVALGIASAMMNLPIVERPVPRQASASA